MTETEDLVLSLSLRSPANQEVHSASTFMIQNNHWQDIFVSDSVSERTSVNDRAESRSFLNGIDMNRIPAVVDFEEEAGISSTNSTISCVSGKRSGREENETERTSDEEDGETSRKKLRLSKEQSAILEESFKEHNTLNPKQKLVLAKQLNLRPRQVEVWFQNRRARTKLKQTEVDCEYLKRCCEKLTEENRRLHREVHELKAMKCVSPHLYMRVPQPTTLTMCHSCHSSNPPTPSKLHHPTIPMVPWTMGRQHHRS